MKVCNYCGTGMDNDVMKCPFCRMDMDVRGAVKYQDDESFDPNKLKIRTRDGETPAELRYEAGLELSMEEHGVSYKNLLEENLDDSAKETVWDDFVKWAESQEHKETPRIEFNLPETTQKKVLHVGGMFKTFLFVVVFIIMITAGILSDDFEDEEYYPSTENFVVGSFENDVYQNEYTGITYGVNDVFHSSEFYPFAIPEIDQDFTFITEFYVERANDHMYISYENAEYCGCETIQEYVDALHISGPNTELISMEIVMLGGKEFYKVITYNEYEQADGKTEKYYYCALVRKVTDDYFAMIEINTEELESIDEFLPGFEYGKDFEDV